MLQVCGQAPQLRLGAGVGAVGVRLCLQREVEARLWAGPTLTEFLCRGSEISAVASSSAEELRREGYAGAELEKREESGRQS